MNDLQDKPDIFLENWLSWKLTIQFLDYLDLSTTITLLIYVTAK